MNTGDKHRQPIRSPRECVHVYLVEDNERIRDNLIETLSELADATIVGWADTGLDGGLWLTTRPGWNLAIVDLMLRDGSGFDILKSCINREAEKKIVVLSNYATPTVRERCLALGANAVFDKSTELEELIDYCLAIKDGTA